MKYLVFSSIPFESELVSDSDMIDNNLFINNVGNTFFTNAVYNTLNSTENKIVRYHEGISSCENFDAGILIHANDIRNGMTRVLDYEYEMMEEFKIPFVMMSIGTDSDSSYNTVLDESVRISTHKLFSKILERSPSVGVRGEHTKKIVVEQCNIQENKIDVIGCPSVRYFGNKLKRYSRAFSRFSKDLKIAVNFTAYHYDIDEAIYLYKVLKEFKNSFVIFTDKVEADLLFKNKPVPSSRRHELLPTSAEHFIIKENRARFLVSQKKIMSMMKTFNFSIGSRIHQAIVSILSGTPALLIAHSTRVLEIAKYHKIPYILRSDLVEKSPSIAELYYMTCAAMNDFYDYYDDGLREYSNYLCRNRITINDDFYI